MEALESINMINRMAAKIMTSRNINEQTAYEIARRWFKTS